jgi:hypothetical protein
MAAAAAAADDDDDDVRVARLLLKPALMSSAGCRIALSECRKPLACCQQAASSSAAWRLCLTAAAQHMLCTRMHACTCNAHGLNLVTTMCQLASVLASVLLLLCMCYDFVALTGTSQALSSMPCHGSQLDTSCVASIGHSNHCSAEHQLLLLLLWLQGLPE